MRRFVLKNKVNRKKRIQNVLSVYKNSRGFTLIESLIAFSILFLISNFILVLLHSIGSIDQRSQSYEEYEFFMFFEEIQRELYHAEAVRIQEGTLYIMTPERTISYSQYHDIVRRRVNGLGHELVLQNVSDFEVQFVNNRLRSRVIFLNGESISKDWFTVHALEFNYE
ncbi:competence type IV pilus minor pilin ComGF [Bacillus litorisediminis]|uniref:competence type IV pilus minor pilin ComGF n=1 Tax=Bacillus litorisediminis TaxID=2922713 RepID=UPI002434B9CD|nr:competence type IV pilus minor pilin ComGF [Bacillus litorisediminis]